MKHQSLSWSIAAALVAWSGHAMPGALAQPETARQGGAQPLLNTPDAPTLQELKTGQFKRYYYVIPVQNVEPEFLAWQLDPAHNQEPEMMAQSRRNLEEAKGGFGTNRWETQDTPLVDNGDGTLSAIIHQPADDDMNFWHPAAKLPFGVDCVLPQPTQHALLITASPEGAREIQALARSLDKPLAQVEVLSQVVEISRDDAKTLGVEFGDQQNKTKGRVSFVKANYSELLTALIAQHKAKIINALRFSAINSLAASSSHATYNPMASNAELVFQQLKLHLTSAQTPADSHFYLANQQRFTVIPTINKNGTIQLRYILCLGFALTTDQSSGLLPLKETQWVDTTTMLEDGDTIAVTGLHKPPAASVLAGNPPDANAPATSGIGVDTEWVIFVTPRIIRRVSAQPNNTAAPLERLEPKPVQP